MNNKNRATIKLKIDKILRRYFFHELLKVKMLLIKLYFFYILLN